MIVEDDRTSLKEGEGLMVKAGLRHMHRADEKLWMMVISKWPHEHGTSTVERAGAIANPSLNAQGG